MADTESVSLFYAEAVSILDYLVKEFGQDKFMLFCQELRDKKNLEKALLLAYNFKNIEELDKEWRRHLNP